MATYQIYECGINPIVCHLFALLLNEFQVLMTKLRSARITQIVWIRQADCSAPVVMALQLGTTQGSTRIRAPTPDIFELMHIDVLRIAGGVTYTFHHKQLNCRAARRSSLYLAVFDLS